MLTLIDRQFIVNAPLATTWQHVARVDEWPTWAHHIRHVELWPQGDLGPQSSGVILLANGLKSTFRMTEFNPGTNWKWVGAFLWLTIYYDHRFESCSSDQTRVRFILDADGFGAGLLGRLFAKIYRRNLETAVPLLVREIEDSVKKK